MNNLSRPTRTATLTVVGMSCGSCERRIGRELDQVAGFRDAAFSLVDGRVSVTYEPALTTPQQLAQVVSRAGYPAEAIGEEPAQPVAASAACGCCPSGRS